MILAEKPIILIGFMGTGKSVVGKKLAKQKGFSFIDIDKKIEKESGMSIPDIFSRFGEAHFRKLEKSSIFELKNIKNAVVATGGGVVLDPENIEAMKELGYLVALDADLETLWKRLRYSRNRPLLQTEDPRTRIKDLYLKRKELYKEAHVIIDTSNKSIDMVVREIIRFEEAGIQ